MQNRRLASVVGILLLACAADRTSVEDDSEQSFAAANQALGTTAQRILGFEGTIGGSGGDWRALNGTATSSTTHIEATRALALSGSINASAVSAPMSTLGPIRSSATISVQLPASLQGQSWLGQIGLFFNAPSAGVYNIYAGSTMFVGPLGSFHQYDLEVPPYIVSALSSKTYNDLTITVQINARTSGAFLVDRLVLTTDGGGGSGGSGTGGTTGKGGTGGTAGASKGGATTGGTAGKGGTSSGGSTGTGGVNTGGTSAGGCRERRGKKDHYLCSILEDFDDCRTEPNLCSRGRSYGRIPLSIVRSAEH